MLFILKKLRFNKQKATFIWLATLLALVAISCGGEQEDPAYRQAIAAERMEINEEFFDPERSPLDSAYFYTFKGLKFFPVQEKYKVKATLTILENEPVFDLPHSHQRTKPYKNYARAKFELEGKTFELTVLEQQNKKPGYESYLLIPFTDETSGKETYGGGRYLDIEKSDAPFVVLDFNKVYNPYCLYSTNFTCPIPPKVNHLPIRIEAGMKAEF